MKTGWNQKEKSFPNLCSSNRLIMLKIRAIKNLHCHSNFNPNTYRKTTFRIKKVNMRNLFKVKWLTINMQEQDLSYKVVLDRTRIKVKWKCLAKA